MANSESTSSKVARKMEKKRKLIRVARGQEPADLVIKNATYLNVFSNNFQFGDIAVSDGLIAGMGTYSGKTEYDAQGKVVLPGFIDAHIHLESSLVSPSEFAKAVVRHGTTTVVTDPHEIANVMGVDGVRYMLEATENLPIDVRFMLPSCVPCSEMDESGADLDYLAIDELYDHPRVLGLAEMMNYVGVINGDPAVVAKILGSQAHHKKIDGHAPGLSGKDLCAYVAAGVYSDHECDNCQNALEKLQLGQFIMIREGTAAKNLRALLPLLNRQYYDRCLFATDDKHPSDLLHLGHIDYIIKECISFGVDPVVAVKVASHNAARYFLMNNKGAIAPGYLADLVITDDFRNLNILRVYKKGKLVFDGKDVIETMSEVEPDLKAKALDTFHLAPVSAKDFSSGKLPLIGLIPHEIVTENRGFADRADPAKDVLKIAVVERHKNTGHIGMGYITGFGLKKGAIATSIAHDSHNIIVIGADDNDIAFAVNRIREHRGGITVVENGKALADLACPIAGLMSDKPLTEANDLLENAKAAARTLGVSKDVDPFMTLSFMSLPVIPSLKVTTHGVFDVDRWQYVK